MISAAFAA